MEAPWLPSSVRSRFIAVVRTFVCLVVVLLATALPSPTAAQFEDLRKLYDEINPPPNHPPFADPISANSPNAAGRYLWLARQVDERAFDAAGYVERSLTEWKLPDYLMDDDVPDVVAWRRWLTEHREWTDAVVEASRLDRFELHRSKEARSDRWGEDDVRRRIHSDLFNFGKSLEDDAGRLWIDGEQEAAIDRVEAIVRMGSQLGVWGQLLKIAKSSRFPYALGHGKTHPSRI